MYDRDFLKQKAHQIIAPLIAIFVKLKLNPNLFTTLGLIFNVVAAAVFIWGGIYGQITDLQYIAWGGIFILLGGVCDVIDGQVARTSGLASKFGALFDSVLDRYSELFMFFGMAYYLYAFNYFPELIAIFFALMGSLMVSYTRARAEGLGIDCSVGWMQRPERIILVAVGAVACGLAYQFNLLTHPIYLFTIPIYIIAIMANVTALHRLYHCYLVTEMNEAEI